MCGIVGYVGPYEALPIVIEGLRRLEYRGYDSAGVAVLDGALTVVKRAGKLAELQQTLDGDGHPAGKVAMGHTRWATHGAPTDRNAHPHLDCTATVAVIHNGIIENFQRLRTRLEKDDHSLVSETDTELVAHLIEERLREGKSLLEAVRSTVKELEGAYSLVVLSTEEPGMLVGVKVASPLVVGVGDGETILASDIPAVLGRTSTVIPVDEGRIVEVRADGATFTDFEGKPAHHESITVDWDVAQAEKGGFDTFMLKEIHEQPGAIRDTLVGRVDEHGQLVLDDLRIPDDVLREVDKVFVVACGTAYHSGLVARYAIEHWTRLPVEIDIASEFRYRDPVLGPDTLTLAVSQSGETIDTLEAARHARRQGSSLLAVTNTVGSSLAREADGVIYMHAGPEIGVAATKTFATQMVSQYILSMYLAQVRGSMFPEEIAEVLTRMDELPGQVQRAIGLDSQVQELAQRFQGARDWLFIGRHTGFPAALEGALKLKEISYLRAEGFPGGELKHGPIALIEPGTVVVAVATRSRLKGKVLSNVEEVKARGATIILVVDERDAGLAAVRKLADHVIGVPGA
ncbi:MAG: glutamine--fructose-6-phosphate transaminase (isomerizing), partial [Actinomycetota bacterium]|nr:glutamine--fructose-6-phosphate transaminase (isomerizing) [Actinomycetota bacterium]